MTQYRPCQVGALHPAMHYNGLFAVLGKERDGDPGHDFLHCIHCHATNFQPRSQVTFVIERDLDEAAGSWGRLEGETSPRLLVAFIVRQT